MVTICVSKHGKGTVRNGRFFFKYTCIGHLLWMKLAGLAVVLGESVRKWLVNVQAWELTAHYCRPYKHCTLWLHQMYKNNFPFFSYKLTLA